MNLPPSKLVILLLALSTFAAASIPAIAAEKTRTTKFPKYCVVVRQASARQFFRRGLLRKMVWETGMSEPSSRTAIPVKPASHFLAKNPVSLSERPGFPKFRPCFSKKDSG